MQSDATDKMNKIHEDLYRWLTEGDRVDLVLIYLSRVKLEDPIVIKVRGQDGGGEICCRMGRNTSLHNLMLDYCDRTGAVYDWTRFLYDGTRVYPSKTADDMKMEDGDIIHMVSDQHGG